MIEIIVNYICHEEENGFWRYSPSPTLIEIDDELWDGYTQIAVASPLACPLYVPFYSAKDYEGHCLYLYGNATNLN
ncbi:hypothetical protein LC593_35255 [Nostoc sp. CHAB 5844]|nr:hypothetical protein [Nostoc sp. CHAB 5844]